MIYIEIVYNLALLISLSVLSGFIRHRRNWSPWIKSMFQGLVFGAIAIIGMLYPLKFSEGVIFDGRSVVIGLCGLFFGPLSTVISGGGAIVLRILIGGSGMTTGILVILASALTGIIFHYRFFRKTETITLKNLIAFAFLIHLAMLFLMYTFPKEVANEVIREIGLLIITIYPIATVIFGKIIIDQIEKGKNTIALAESEERYRTFICQLSEGVYRLEFYHAPDVTIPDENLSVEILRNAYVAETNPALEKMYCPQDENDTRDSGMEKFPEGPEKLVSQEFLLKFIRNGFRLENEITEEENNKGKRLVLSNNTIGIIKDNHLLRIWGSKTDITEKVRAEKKLKKALKKAQESDRLKSAFLANISHEVRTPMNGIIGFTELLGQTDLNPQMQQKYISIIRKSGQRMLNTVNDLIEISKIETGQMQVKKSETNLSVQLRNLWQLFNPQAVEKGLTLILNDKIPPEKAIFTTDVMKLDTILTNLIRNAIKFTDEGLVEITCQYADGKIKFQVRDTGIGIPYYRQKVVFNRFEHAHSGNTGAIQGSGLGLAIAKAYVEMLGGTIGLISEPENGSVFWFELPVEEPLNDQKMEYSQKLNVTDEAVTGKLKMAIAEDDDTSFLYLRTVLRDLTSQIIRCENGEQAIETARNHPDIDLFLMDIRMPGINGHEATRKIREFNPGMIIIAQTAFAFPGDREKALEAGCNDYISKPVRKNELLAIISKMIN